MKNIGKKANLRDKPTDNVSVLNQIKNEVMTLNPNSVNGENILESQNELDNASWVDFSEIRYFIEPPSTPESSSILGGVLDAADQQLLNDIDANGGDGQNYLANFHIPFKAALFRAVSSNILRKNGEKNFNDIRLDSTTGIIYSRILMFNLEWEVHKIVSSLIDRYLKTEYLIKIVELYSSVIALNSNDPLYSKEAFFKEIENHWDRIGDTEAIWQFYCELAETQFLDYPNSLWVPTTHWPFLIERLSKIFIFALIEGEYEFTFPAPSPYKFEAFPKDTYNLGLRLVYRQEWRPLGTQSGEVVRTIPLGPKQSEKVSTKIIRRKKVTHTSENLKSEESTTETSDSSKDSSEIIKEASSAMKWDVNQEVEGGYNCGIWHVGGKTSFGLGGESTENSKETSSKLSETMRKTANKLRTESKVIVSTEFEETFEATSASEIQNPNDEIAITYVYSKLQMQYEILTQLAEVQDVVLVAEELTPAENIGFEWVKRHDWIIAKVLLDDSFREALNSISQALAQQPTAMKMLGTDLLNARDRTISSLDKFAGSSVAADNIDFVQESQKAYSTGMKEYIQALKHKYLLELKRFRLYEHIRENILHYSRAIWQQEDPQQRMLRYRKSGIRVPQNWWFLPDVGSSMTIAEFINTYGPNYEANLKGKYIGDENGPTIPITDLINPAGPISFYGNYAVYYLRPEYARDGSIMPLLEIFKLPYWHNGELMDPAQKEQEILWTNQVTNSDIDDPVYMDMIDYVPDLRLKYLKALKARPNSNEEIDALSLLGYPIFKKYYPEYKFRIAQTRRFLLDTNCLRIDLITGNGSALEPFKQMHRGIDVLKAEQERLKMELENNRRQKLLDAGQYGDPDIKKVTVITGNTTQLGPIVAGMENSESTCEANTVKDD